LLFAWSTRYFDLELVPVHLNGRAADPPQEELQVVDEPWIADEDVQAADALGVAANEGRFLSVVTTIPLSSPIRVTADRFQSIISVGAGHADEPAAKPAGLPPWGIGEPGSRLA
jgi:hypothetical protein